MVIGINAAAAIKQPRTGVEEYVYRLIKHLAVLPEARGHRFFLYLPAELAFDFPLPEMFVVKVLKWPWPFLWTQIRLAWEIWRRPPDILFIPVHILPFFSPRKSITTIHGLEYEYFPEYYSFWRRRYLRWGVRSAARRARQIIAISMKTKDDLVKIYGVGRAKIRVVHHGAESRAGAFDGDASEPYLLFLGRIESKKNISGLLDAYAILKEKYKIPHKLVLAGAPGYGYKKLKAKISSLKFKIVETGYVGEREKWRLLAGAEALLFLSFYEGFGLPVLEAQAIGTPVIVSDNSCLSEIAGQGAIFVNPRNSLEIAAAVKRLIDDKVLRDKLIWAGAANVKMFSWEKCARETLAILLSTGDEK